MISRQQFNLWRHLSRTQIGLGIVTILLAAAVAVLVLNLFAGIVTTNNAFRNGYLVTDLTDVQRAILELRNAHNLAMAAADGNFDNLTLKRSLLTSQLRLAITESSANVLASEGLGSISQLLAQYDAQLAVLKASPTQSAYEAATPELDALLTELAKQVLFLFNSEERLFFSSITEALSFQRRTQIIALALSGLFLVFGSLLVLSLQKTVSTEFSNAYQLLKTEVAERKQATAELERSEQALISANQILRLHNDRLQSELVLARKIQQGLLPNPRPYWHRLDVACWSLPAREVGGDFYAYHILDDQRFIIAVGDVSGKGMSAALLMATSLAQLDSSLQNALPPSDLLSHLDRSLGQYTVTTNQNCALCYVEINEMTMHVANAGCMPPYIRRTSGQVEELSVGGAPLGLGIGSQFGYDAQRTELQAGDQIILSSDGLVEAHVSPDNLFGFDRFEAAIAAGPSSSAQAMLDHLHQEMLHFIGDAEPPDDVTLVVMQVRA